MFGIPGLDPLGLVHTGFGFAALIAGLLVLLTPKGTHRHRRLGQSYVVFMVLLNATALMIYDLFDGFGPFHFAALVSLATLIAGFVPAYTQKSTSWMRRHAAFMAWSYIGLLAAFISEIATHIPGVRFGYGVSLATFGVVAGGALLIRAQVPRIVARLSK